MNDQPDVGRGVFGGREGEWFRLVRDGRLVFVTDEQLGEMEILRRGGNPCQVIVND